MSNSELSDKQNKEKTPFLSKIMGGIAIAQAILILAVAITIFSNRHIYKHDLSNAIVTNEVVTVSDSTALTNSIAENNQPTKGVAGILESFETDYMAILLSLITLCATLAVVIPYLIGKIFTESEVRKGYQVLEGKLSTKVDKLDYERLEKRVIDRFEEERRMTEETFRIKGEEYAQRIKGVDKEIENTLDVLDMEVAHDARMIAYLLSHKADKHDNSLETNAWTIGWASKSLIRYLKKDYGDYYHLESFIGQCLDLILTAGDSLQSNCSDENKSIFVRAFVDLFDTCCISENNRLTQSIKFAPKVTALKRVLKELYCAIADEQLALSALCGKSKQYNKTMDVSQFRLFCRGKLQEFKILDAIVL